MRTLEQVITALTVATNGQYPRPWMTAMSNPLLADVFIVGYNPAKAYSTSALKHSRHIDGLFNRNGETCRGLYSELTNESPTRGNIETLTHKLAQVGVANVLETNLICYSTSKKKELLLHQHAGGKARGLAIFRAVLREICPKVVIVHGVGVRDEFNRSFHDESPLPSPPTVPGSFPQVALSFGTQAFVVPSLALPGYRNWPPGNSFCNWADSYLTELSQRVHAVIAAEEPARGT